MVLPPLASMMLLLLLLLLQLLLVVLRVVLPPRWLWALASQVVLPPCAVLYAWAVRQVLLAAPRRVHAVMEPHVCAHVRHAHGWRCASTHLRAPAGAQGIAGAVLPVRPWKGYGPSRWQALRHVHEGSRRRPGTHREAN